MFSEYHDNSWDSENEQATHVGALAGLSEEERAAAVDEGLRTRPKRFDDYGFHDQAAAFWDEDPTISLGSRSFITTSSSNPYRTTHRKAWAHCSECWTSRA